MSGLLFWGHLSGELEAKWGIIWLNGSGRERERINILVVPAEVTQRLKRGLENGLILLKATVHF